MFLVEADRGGVVPVDTGDKLGLRTTRISDLRFGNVRIPDSNLIGDEGAGLAQADAVHKENRILMAAIAIGIGQGALDRTIDYIKKREQFGKKIAQFQINQHKITEMAVKLEQARMLTYMAASLWDHKKNSSSMSAMAKLASSKAALEVAYEAIQLFGGYGYTTEYEVERYYRDAKCIEIAAEKTCSLKDLVAGNVIGRIR